MARTTIRPALICVFALPTLIIGEHRPVAQEQGQFGRVIRIDRNAFTPKAGLITFDEYARGTQNPRYEPNRYGGVSNGVTVIFGGYFEGQEIAAYGQCPGGASRTGCVGGKPLSPLRIDQGAPVTFPEPDNSNPRSPSLSGTPRFNGPISMVFDRDVAGVGLFGGYFNTLRSTAIQAYSRDGRLIGGVKNIEIGMEYLALVTEDGRDAIAGLQFSLVGPEPAGFAIDDLSFAFASQLNMKNIPGLRDLLSGGDEANEPVPDAIRKNPAKPSTSLSDLMESGPKSPGKKSPEKKSNSIGDLLK